MRVEAHMREAITCWSLLPEEIVEIEYQEVQKGLEKLGRQIRQDKLDIK